jgi:hypothetical protein
MSRHLAIAACLIVFVVPSWGGLGDDRILAEAVQQLDARRTTGAGTPFTVARYRLPTGTLVHALRDDTGLVFAVSWSGPFLPDLRDLLGPHFNALADQQRRPGPGGNLLVRSEQLVVMSGGRLGAFAGRAWLPGNLPAGFDPKELP